MSNRHGKVAIFIDGANLHATAKALGIRIDFRRLLAAFAGSGELVRAYYYSAVPVDFVPIKPLLDWLDYNGFTVVTKPLRAATDAGDGSKIPGCPDVELAVDAMTLSTSVEQIIIFSGDGAFCPLVVALQRRGVRVSIVSSIATSPPMVASELRRQADVFLDLNDLNLKQQPAHR